MVGKNNFKILKAIKWASKNSDDSLRNLIILKGQYQPKQWNNIKNNNYNIYDISSRKNRYKNNKENKR